jgi:histidine decarboxylase
VDSVKGAVEYIGSFDSTLSGSRDGFSVLVLWQALMRLGTEGLSSLVRDCVANTSYAIDTLRGIDWPAWANRFSNIVVIRRPPDELVRKWQLATERDISHLIVMPGVSRERIDAFAGDLVEARRNHDRRLL